MEQYSKILLLAKPFFLFLIVIEKAYGYFKEVNCGHANFTFKLS